MEEQDIIKQAENIVENAYNNDIIKQAEEVADATYGKEVDRMKNEYDETIAEVNRALFKLNELNQRMGSVGISREDMIASYPVGRDYIESLNKCARTISDFYKTVVPQPEPTPEPIEPMPEPTPDRDSTCVDYSEIDYNGMDNPNTTINDFKSHEQGSNEKHI